MSVVSWQRTALEYVGTRVPPKSDTAVSYEDLSTIAASNGDHMFNSNRNAERNKKCGKESHKLQNGSSPHRSLKTFKTNTKINPQIDPY